MTALGTWKAFERRAAAHFGTTRFLPTQRNEDKHSRDFETDELIGECKLRAEWPSPVQIATWYETLENRNKRNEILEGGGNGIRISKKGEPQIFRKRAVLCLQIKQQRGFWIIERLQGKLRMTHTSWVCDTE